MTKRLLSSVFVTVLIPVAAAQAGPATPEEAGRLAALFDRYVGRAAPGEPGSVTVTPEGQTYRASFDVQRMMKPFEAYGVAVDPATIVLLLIPGENGLWRVTSDTFPPLVMHFGPQTITMRSASYRLDGTFDPKIPGFSDATTTQSGTTIDQDSPKLSQQRRTESVTFTQKAASSEGGAAGFEMHYALSNLSDRMSFRSAPPPAAASPQAPTANDARPTPAPSPAQSAPPGPASAPAPVEVNYSVPSAVMDIALDGFHARDALDIWAFFVAHSDRASIAAHADELKLLMRNALPLVAALRQSGSLDRLSVETPVGPFSVAKIASDVQLADLAAAARAAVGARLSGLKVPTGDLPPWAVDLIPTEVDLHQSFTGLRLMDAAREAIDDLDVKGAGLTAAQKEKIGHLLMPTDGASLDIQPSRLTSPLLDLRFEGALRFSASAPTGKLTVTAAGLDKAISSLQGPATTDLVAQQVLAQFAAAKNLAKANPDGTLAWTIEAASGGPLTVNGLPLR